MGRTATFLMASAALSLLSSAAYTAPITVTVTDDATTLANALGGVGVTISNATYTGAAGAAGTFTGGTAAGLNINEGILLTSGSAASAGQPWSTDSGVPSTDNGTAGTASITDSHDAATLAFHFTSTSTTASFTYFFASAEYSAFVNSAFNDEFQFLFNGKNIALIPGTSTPVAINNVNNGGPNSATGLPPISNPGFFIDNLMGQNPDFDYDGLTDNFSASISGLTPGADNVISLVIADVSDSILDSAVFIEAGSFTNLPPPEGVPEPTTLALFGTGLLGLAYMRRRFVASRFLLENS
jgi:hypothetical protein